MSDPIEVTDREATGCLTLGCGLVLGLFGFTAIGAAFWGFSGGLATGGGWLIVAALVAIRASRKLLKEAE